MSSLDLGACDLEHCRSQDTALSNMEAVKLKDYHSIY